MSTLIQSVRFPKNNFTLKQARKWVKSHGYRTTWRGKGVDETENQYRFRQKSPNYPHKKVKTITIPRSGGIQLIIYYL